MIGPVLRQRAYMVCTACEVVITKQSNPTKKFPKNQTWNYCKHPELDTQVAFIRGYPVTPKWCPARKEV